MEKTKKNRFKKVILAALAVAAVATITASMTFAYLTGTDTKTNMFTGSDNVTAVLFETKWDGSTAANGGVAAETLTDTMGAKIAEHYSINSAIPKDPKIANTCATEEYVAIKLVYKVKLDGTNYTEVSKAEFDALVTINNLNTTDWTNISGTDIYYYNSALAANSETSALFDSVTVNSTLIPGEAFKLSDTKTIALDKDYPMPAFEIEIKGAVVDTADFTNAAGAATTLQGLFA